MGIKEKGRIAYQEAVKVLKEKTIRQKQQQGRQGQQQEQEEDGEEDFSITYSIVLNDVVEGYISS
jgi:hypothetical protein